MGKGARLRRQRMEVARAARARDGTRKEAAERGAEEGRRRGCLFCRQSDGGFTSVEHILPESLGNETLTLPVGVVCDRCNNGVLAEPDQALGSFLPIEMMKTWHGIPSKAGKLPEFKFDNGSMRCQRPGDLFLIVICGSLYDA
jgi:hypothetical protein